MDGFSFLVSPESVQQQALWAGQVQSSFDRERSEQMATARLKQQGDEAEARQKAQDARQLEHDKTLLTMNANSAAESMKRTEVATERQVRHDMVNQYRLDANKAVAPLVSQIESYNKNPKNFEANKPYINKMSAAMGDYYRQVNNYQVSVLNAESGKPSPPPPDLSGHEVFKMQASVENPDVQRLNAERIRQSEAQRQQIILRSQLLKKQIATTGHGYSDKYHYAKGALLGASANLQNLLDDNGERRPGVSDADFAAAQTSYNARKEAYDGATIAFQAAIKNGQLGDNFSSETPETIDEDVAGTNQQTSRTPTQDFMTAPLTPKFDVPGTVPYTIKLK